MYWQEFLLFTRMLLNQKCCWAPFTVSVRACMYAMAIQHTLLLAYFLPPIIKQAAEIMLSYHASSCLFIAAFWRFDDLISLVMLLHHAFPDNTYVAAANVALLLVMALRA